MSNNPIKRGKVDQKYQSGLNLNPDIFDKAAGLYVYSMIQHTGRSKKKVFKIGKSTNLWNRLSGYHTCYMDGYTLHNVALLVDYEGHFTDLKDRQMATIQKRISYMERQTHKILARHKVGTASRASEWYEIDDGKVDRITRAIQKAYREAPVKVFPRTPHAPIKMNGEKAPTLIADLANAKYDRKNRNLGLPKFFKRRTRR